MKFQSYKQQKRVMAELKPTSGKKKKKDDIDTPIVKDIKEQIQKPLKKWDLEVRFANEDYEPHKDKIKVVIKDKFGLSKWDFLTNEWYLPTQPKFDERTIVVRRLVEGGKTSGLMVKGSKALADVLKAILEETGVKYEVIDTEKNILQERIEESVNEWKDRINREVSVGRLTQEQANERIAKIRKLAEKYQPELMKRETKSL